MTLLKMTFKRTQEAEDVCVRVGADRVMFLAKFLSKDPNQEALTCLRIEPCDGGGVFIVALDGHRMGVFHDADGFCEEAVCISVRPDLVKNCKGKWDEQHRRLLELDSLGQAAVRDEIGFVYYIEPMPVTRSYEFPQWSGILERAISGAEGERTAGAVAFPADLSLFNLPAKERMALAFHPGGATDPVLVRHAAYEDFVGVLMPMRVAEDTCLFEPRPDWFRSADAVAEFENVDRFSEQVEQSLQ